MKMVGVFSKNREEWMLLEYANFLYGNTMIPLYDTLGILNFKYFKDLNPYHTFYSNLR